MVEKRNTENGRYWQERFLQIQEAELRKSDDYAKELEQTYNRTLAKINADVSMWYSRYATENGLTLAEAQKQLSLKELQEYRMTVEEYIEAGRQLGVDNPELEERLRKASSKAHITRLQALKNQINMKLNELHGQVTHGIRKRLAEAFKNILGHTLFNIDKSTGVGMSTAGLSTKEVEKILLKPWTPDGRNFSDRIWTNKEKLLQSLEKDLTTCLIRGENPSTLIDKFAEEFKVTRYQAGRLLHTETAFFNSLATIEAFKKRGVDEYQIDATLDKRTSEICQEMDGQHFKVNDYEVGVNAPPFHPNCRTCIVPYYDDEFTQDEKRASRNADGKTVVEVPARMTYKEWKEKFLKPAK